MLGNSTNIDDIRRRVILSVRWHKTVQYESLHLMGSYSEANFLR